MAEIIMVILTVLMVLTFFVMLIMRRDKKRILKTLAGFLTVIGLFYLYVDKTCGPNAKDIEIMTPQANVIAKYILNNGVPKSLADIDNLPYDLQGCNHQKGYYDFAKDTDETDYVETSEECRFEIEDRKYEVDFHFVEHFRAINDTHGTLKIKNTDTQTGILILLETDENGDITVDFHEYPVVYSVKSTGICNPMRQ